MAKKRILKIDERGTIYIALADLKSGQVRLNLLQRPDTLTMQSGERVTLSAQTKTLEKQEVNPEAYIGWT